MGHIVLKNVTKSFESLEVIPPLNLTIDDGEFAVFVGPSGCGKSTLLRMIAGLEEVTSGEIAINVDWQWYSNLMHFTHICQLGKILPFL